MRINYIKELVEQAEAFAEEHQHRAVINFPVMAKKQLSLLRLDYALGRITYEDYASIRKKTHEMMRQIR